MRVIGNALKIVAAWACALLAACGSAPSEAPAGPAPVTVPADPVPAPADTADPAGPEDEAAARDEDAPPADIDPAGAGGLSGIPGPECATPDSATPRPPVLLRIDCDGAAVPGRASWSRAGGAVHLTFGSQGPPASSGGFGLTGPAPVGAALVDVWPALSEPPWLGHQVERVLVQQGGAVTVDFREPPARPELLFADPRLSGWGVAADDDLLERDRRDDVDADSLEVLTRHDGTIEYARALGRDVRRLWFDRLYVVAFAGAVAREPAAAAGREVAERWAAWGAAGARREAAERWRELAAWCRGAGWGAAAAQPAAPDAAGERATVSYPEGLEAAGQIAEQLTAASAPGAGGAMGAVLRGLALGGEAGGAVRGARLYARAVPASGDEGSRARSAEGREARSGRTPPAGRASRTGVLLRAPSDVAAVVSVHAGPGHPCSTYAEAVRVLAEWAPRRAAGEAGAGATHVIAVGETALFRIAPASGGP